MIGRFTALRFVAGANIKSTSILPNTGLLRFRPVRSVWRALWRSNDEPPVGAGDARAYLTAHDLHLDRNLIEDVLDTPLFRGEGAVFEPMHRTVAEFLAGQALAKAVVGTDGRAALPLSRATALIAGSDGGPPTELRGLYAWFAAHLAKFGDEAGALRLIEADAVTVLAYDRRGKQVAACLAKRPR
jgi:hypothetical protein